MAFITIRDNYGREKKIPCVKGTPGEDAFLLARNNGFTGKMADFKKNMGQISIPYRVGQIYMTLSSTSPASTFGGTWEQIKDAFLIASGGSYTTGGTGGEATVTLTVEQLANHRHQIPYIHSQGSGAWAQECRSSSGSQDCSGSVWETGGSGAHNNLPPYLVVYAWKRVS